MPNRLVIRPPGFDELSIDEQIEYLQSLWDRIAARWEDVPVPDWHHEVLHERIRDYQRDPESGESWDVVCSRLRETLAKRQPR